MRPPATANHIQKQLQAAYLDLYFILCLNLEVQSQIIKNKYIYINVINSPNWQICTHSCVLKLLDEAKIVHMIGLKYRNCKLP